MAAVGCGFISMYHKMMSKRSCAPVFARYDCKRRHSPRRSSPGWHVAGLLALRNTNSGGAPGADPPERPCARPRRERGQDRAAPWPAHVRTGRGSGWNGVARSRGFRSMWWNRRSRRDRCKLRYLMRAVKRWNASQPNGSGVADRDAIIHHISEHRVSVAARQRIGSE